MATQNILFCDESITDPEYLKNILASANCGLIITKTGNEAIKKAKSEKPDFIYMNIVSLGVDSYSVVLCLRNDPETRSIPIVFYSSKQQTADSIWAKMQTETTIKAKRNLKETPHEYGDSKNYTIH
ncbi:two-component system response regulator [Methylomicrobium sp. Wu6]|uniref:response regulator n=1 Tax=Methylomicrobium sp. Wu6 TaxID=3107928 RepID=UPI002DD67C0B|nr:two-component system response regulator [Methylomicrobium sp. Wu6]MEC4748238.1 two-component system response regulator [Methylomicrobium sp. Wu6]